MHREAEDVPSAFGTREQETWGRVPETDRSVSEICLDVGFTSLGIFGRTFRGIVVSRPYRKPAPPLHTGFQDRLVVRGATVQLRGVRECDSPKTALAVATNGETWSTRSDMLRWAEQHDLERAASGPRRPRNVPARGAEAPRAAGTVRAPANPTFRAISPITEADRRLRLTVADLRSTC